MGAGSGPRSDGKFCLKERAACAMSSGRHHPKAQCPLRFILWVFQVTGADSSIVAKCQWNDTAGTAIEAMKAPEEFRQQQDPRVTPQASSSPSSSSPGNIPYAAVAVLAVLGAAETAYLTQVRRVDGLDHHKMSADGVIVNILPVLVVIYRHFCSG